MGELPCAEDFLGLAKETLYGLAYLAQATIGNNTGVNGFAIAPTGPASLSFTIGSGSIYALQTADATAYGVLGTDANTIFKQGILAAPVTLTVTPPATSGFSQVYLVQVAYSDVDGGASLVPFFNSLDPTHPSSSTQNTVRFGQAVIELKAGTAASTGSQNTPAPDAGFTALWSITVANGATAVTSANWLQLSSGPFAAPWFPSLENLASLFVQMAPATTFYVNATTGNDANTGLTAATAWATITNAVAVISGFASSSAITVNIAAGTYAGFVVNSSPISAWNFVGAGAGSTIIGPTLGNSTGVCVFVSSNCILSGVTVNGSSTASTACVIWQGAGARGYCTGCVLNSFSTGTTWGIAYITGATGTLQGTVTFKGIFAFPYWITNNASVFFGATVPFTVTTSGTVAITGSFIEVQAAASVSVAPSVVTITGTFTGGTKFGCTGAGGIFTNGGGVNFFPGASAGVLTSPGYYYN